MARDPLDELARQLTSDEGYVTGRRSFPRTVTPETAADLADRVHQALDEGTAARVEAAKRNGITIACKAGCSGCCEELVMVYRPEALAVARWLLLPENAAVLASFLEAYPEWRERVGDGPQRLADAHASGDTEANLKAHVEQWRKRILCAFNRDGLCTIYAVRPILCRNAHAINTSEYCYGDNKTGILATRIKAKALDDFVEKSRALIRSAHHAIGGPRQRNAALCEAVYEMVRPKAE